MKKLLLFLFFPSVMLLAQTEKDLIGSWQITNHVASGYNDAYTFSEDGKFTFNYNQMDCSKREVSYGGYWELKGKQIILTINFTEKYFGGKLEPSTGSCASDSELVGGFIVKVPVIPGETKILNISDWRIDTEEGMERTMILINNTRYWHFSKFDYGK